MSGIKRYHWNGDEAKNGDVVKFSDHVDEVAKCAINVEKVRGYEVAPLQAEIARLPVAQEPAAYQRRDSLHPHCEGWTDWRETDKSEFDRLNKLRAEQPAFFRHVETRALYAAPVDLVAVVASLRKAEAVLAKSDKLNRDMVMGRAIAPFVAALVGEGGAP